MLAESTSPLTRFAALDGLRGWAALSVLFSHVVGALALDKSYWLTLIPFRLMWDGTGAVALFFVLSGFVLSVPFNGNTGQVGSRVGLIIGYWVRRVLRILPAHAFVLVVCLLGIHLLAGVRVEGWSEWITGFWNKTPSIAEFVSSALLIGPKFDSRTINPVIWTLVIELKISLIYPMFPIAAAILGARVSAAGALFFGVWLWGTGVTGYWPYLFQFMVGGIIFRLIADHATSIKRYRIEILLSCLLLYLSSLFAFESRDSVAAQLVLGLAFGGLILSSLTVVRLRCALESAISQFLGKVSFSLYLLHLPLLLAFVRLTTAQDGIEKASFVMIFLCSSLLLATLLNRFVEIPAMRLGRDLDRRIRLEIETAWTSR